MAASQIRPRPLPSTPFPIQYSLFSVSCVNVTQCACRTPTHQLRVLCDRHTQRLTYRWKSVFIIKDLYKNNLKILKDIHIICVSFIINTFIFSEKKAGGIILVPTFIRTYVQTESRLAPHSRRELISARSLSQRITLTTWKSLQHELHQATVHTLLNTPHDSSAKIKQLRGLYAQTFLTF